MIKVNKRIHSNSNRRKQKQKTEKQNKTNNNSLSLHFSFGLSITLWTGSRSAKLARTGKVQGELVGQSSKRVNYYHARFESSGFGSVRDDALTVRFLPMPKTYQVFYLIQLWQACGGVFVWRSRINSELHRIRPFQKTCYLCDAAVTLELIRPRSSKLGRTGADGK